jgi:DNA polymerase
MAAARKKKAEAAIESEAVNLIDILTMPGHEGRYENEIVAGQEYEELVEEFQDSPQSYTPDVAGKPETRAEPRPRSSARKDINNFADLNAIMNSAGSQTVKTGPENKLPDNFVVVENDSLEQIAKEVAECEKCELCKTRIKTVPGIGSGKAKLVFIGEAPGADEDESGIPFVGRAGKHLDKIMAAAGFKKEEVFICNILKCRPPGNRNPTIPEMQCCTPFLRRQLALIKPDLIACLGNVAVRFVIGPTTPGITKVHGEWFKSIFNIPAMAMYHPSYLIRSESRAKGSPNWQMWQDIQQLKKRYDSL